MVLLAEHSVKGIKKDFDALKLDSRLKWERSRGRGCLVVRPLKRTFIFIGRTTKRGER